MEGETTTPKPNRRTWRSWVAKQVGEDWLMMVFGVVSAVGVILCALLMVMGIGLCWRVTVEAFRWGYRAFGLW